MCYPFLLSTLANTVLKNGGVDFITVFQEDEKFDQFSRLSHLSVERSGFTYEPIEIQVRLQLKSINAVDLYDEFLDATVFMTLEWIDPNLAWKVKERDLKEKSASVPHRNRRSHSPVFFEFFEFSPVTDYIEEFDPQG